MATAIPELSEKEKERKSELYLVCVCALAHLTTHHSSHSLLGTKAPAKIQEVTLMRPIHGNL